VRRLKTRLGRGIFTGVIADALLFLGGLRSEASTALAAVYV